MLPSGLRLRTVPSPTRGEGAVGDLGQGCGIYRLLSLFSRPYGTDGGWGRSPDPGLKSWAEIIRSLRDEKRTGPRLFPFDRGLFKPFFGAVASLS